MSTQLKKGVLDLIVLSKINEKDTYGYDIYQRINKNMGISESTIYPILRKFIKNEFCETYLKESVEGPPRRYFRISKRGVSKLQELKLDWRRFENVVNILLAKNL